MMNRMVIGNLVHRPLRSLISVVAVALEVTLILLIVGLCLGMLQDTRTRTAGIGADVLVLPPGSSFIAGLTGAPMPIKIGGVLAKLPHVKSVAPVITQVSSTGSLEIIAGIDLPSYESMSAGFRYLAGGPFQGPNDVLVDDLFAKSKHARVGDTIEILNNKFRISGIVERGKGGRKFLIASHEGQAFVVNEDDCVGNTRKGKQVLNVEMPNEARVVKTVAGDMVWSVSRWSSDSSSSFRPCTRR